MNSFGDQSYIIIENNYFKRYVIEHEYTWLMVFTLETALSDFGVNVELNTVIESNAKYFIHNTRSIQNI